ncbi:MAG: transglycosylase domain-containing protein [Alphaproteobacteria bacterium]|nr:transglycosylase domain-containing protein [Alphaproteobacteria bacterium]
MIKQSIISKICSILLYSLGVVFILFVSGGCILYHYGRDLPSELSLLEYNPPKTTRIFASDNTLIEEYAIEHRICKSLESIPRIIKAAFITAEDQYFYKHSGIDIISIARAAIENTIKMSWRKNPAGGSTITQQIAKNLLVGNARNFSRKIREAIMAFRIESSMPKDKILEIYLNQLYLGKGCYGVAEAYQHFFNKSLDQSTPEEAAFLAAIPSAPSIYINKKNSKKMRAKRNQILSNMYEKGYITRDEFFKAVRSNININFSKNKLRMPYVSDEIFRLFSRYVPIENFFTGGYSIKTTIDSTMQHIAEKALEDGLIEQTIKEITPIGNIKDMSLKEVRQALPNTRNIILPAIITKSSNSIISCEMENGKNVDIRIEQKDLSKGDIILLRKVDSGYEPYKQPSLTGGIIIMDPSNGDVLAMTGGYNFDISSFNCVTQAKRQPGSTIKPFVYAAAIENGKDENDLVDDKPVHIKLSNGQIYSPKNYDGKTFGKTPLMNGVIYSRNLTTVNLAIEVGMNNISKMLINAELSNKKIPISGVLGSIETSPLKLVSAFSAFVNNGKMIAPRFIKSIECHKNSSVLKTLINKLTKPKEKRIMSTQTASIMGGILRKAIVEGTGKSLLTIEEKCNVKFIGKTGTTNDYKDAWFVGAFEHKFKTYLICVFVGYPIPHSLGEHKTGAKVALPIVSKFIQEFTAHRH